MLKSSLVFFGNEVFCNLPNYNHAPILESLIHNKYPIEAVVIKKKSTRSRHQRDFAILELAKKHSLPAIIIQKRQDLMPTIQSFKSPLSIVASFGWILPSQALKHFRLGVLNLHPSLLPLYRGTTPVETALLDDVKQTGVSLIKLSEEMDAGDIYAQSRLQLSDSVTKHELTLQLGQLSAKLLVDTLPDIFTNKIQAKPQNHQSASYTQPIQPAIIKDLKTQSGGFWQRYIRAYLHCPNNRFQIKNLVVEPLVAEVIQADSGKDIYYDHNQRVICLACRGDYLAIHKLKPANRKEMTASEFVNGFCQELIKSDG